MRLIEEILADINKAKAKVTSVELEIGHTTGVSSQINRLIQAQNLLTYCHSRLSDIDPASLRPKEEWIEVKGRTVCSQCGNYPLYDWFGKFKLSDACPTCGADMRGEATPNV